MAMPPKDDPPITPDPASISFGRPAAAAAPASVDPSSVRPGRRPGRRPGEPVMSEAEADRALRAIKAAQVGRGAVPTPPTDPRPPPDAGGAFLQEHSLGGGYQLRRKISRRNPLTRALARSYGSDEPASRGLLRDSAGRWLLPTAAQAPPRSPRRPAPARAPVPGMPRRTAVDPTLGPRPPAASPSGIDWRTLEAQQRDVALRGDGQSVNAIARWKTAHDAQSVQAAAQEAARQARGEGLTWAPPRPTRRRQVVGAEVEAEVARNQAMLEERHRRLKAAGEG